MKIAKILTHTAAIIAVTLSSASADEILVNGSFENTGTPITVDTANPAWGDTAAGDGLTTWAATASGTYGLASGDGFGADPAGAPYFAGNTGTQLAANDGATFLTSTSGGNNILTQTISGLSAGTFDLSYDLGKVTFGAGTLTAQVEVFDGANDTAASLYDVTTDVDSLANVTWNSLSATSLANTGSDLFVRISLVDSNANGQLAIDNVSIDQIPEPATLGMVAIFGGSILFIRRKLMV